MKKAETFPEYVELRNLVNVGFPAYKKELPSNMQMYWKYRENLSVIKNVIVFNLTRFFVPPQMRQDTLKGCHKSHQGQRRFVLYLKNFYFWPGLYTDAISFVSSCKFCQDTLPGNKSGEQRGLPPLRFPMEEIHADVAKSRGMNVLIVICRFSGWLSWWRSKGVRGDGFQLQRHNSK